MGDVIRIDTRQQAGKHEIKNEWWASHEVPTVREKLDFGDYQTSGSNISIDTKRNVAEIAQNIGGKEHARFKRECLRAADAGYRLVILIENDEGITNLETLSKWTNEHCRFCSHFRKRRCNPHGGGKCAKHGTRKPIQGERLAKAMKTMGERYGVVFEFCEPKDTARQICLLLGIDFKIFCRECYRFCDGLCLAAYGMQLIEGPPRKVDGEDAMCEWGCPF